jgi:hypothetical protein
LFSKWSIPCARICCPGRYCQFQSLPCVSIKRVGLTLRNISSDTTKRWPWQSYLPWPPLFGLTGHSLTAGLCLFFILFLDLDLAALRQRGRSVSIRNQSIRCKTIC